MNYSSASEIRKKAKASLSGNWGTSLLVCLVNALCTGFAAGTGILGIVVSGPLMLGQSNYFLKLVRGEQTDFEMLFSGFDIGFSKSIVANIVSGIFTFLWSLLLIIPGIIMAIAYSMCYFLLVDEDIKGSAAVNRSKEITRGHKGRYFCLCLSFIGWWLLGILTLGILFLWIEPYQQASFAIFYDELNGKPYEEPEIINY